jgi:hypothetical protein
LRFFQGLTFIELGCRARSSCNDRDEEGRNETDEEDKQNGEREKRRGEE